MRPIRLALPLCLLLGPVLAQGQSGTSVPVPPRMPPSPPPAPRPPPPPPPEEIAAYRAAGEGERLLVAGRAEEAIAHFRRTVASSPAANETVHAINALHARVLAFLLIRTGRLDEADRELAWFLALARTGDPLTRADLYLRLLDLRLYIQAGRGNIDEVLALLEARARYRGSPHAGCPSGPWFPVVVAPAHHDPRVAASLRALGCVDSIIDQLDEPSARPIGDSRFDALPPRPPAPAPR